MAHSLSPASFHYQCSPGAESQQRHVGYNSNRQHHRNEVVSKEKSSNRLRLSSLKGKSWSAFADVIGCESSDDDSDGDTDEDPLAAPGNRHHKRGSIVRLKNKDRALYGTCPMTDPFAVVVCKHCRMVLKAPSLKSHMDRQRHEKERKHDYGDAVVKLEKMISSSDKTSGVTEKFDKISVVREKSVPPVASFSGAVEKSEKLEKSVDGRQRHRHFQRKSATPSENSNDAVQPDPVPSAAESSSASNSPQPRRRKRKLVEEAAETFQNSPAPPTTCIIVEPPDLVLPNHPNPSSPPPLAPLAPSVWIVTPTQPSVTIIDGSFVVKPLVEQEEAEIDLKDLKVLKPVVKESLQETPTMLTPSNWYATQPRPLTVNTFNMRKLNAQRMCIATQRKLIELGRNLRTEEKVVGGKGQPKTWSFIERSQVFIPFRVTH